MILGDTLSCKIYLIRHGQSLGNLNATFLGHTDLDLSPLGYSQAEMSCKYLLDKGIDVVYSSDLIRAFNTSKPLCDALGLKAIKNRNFREIYAGLWEGKTFNYLTETYPETYSVWRNDIGNAKIDDGETVQELYHRITTEIKKIASECDGKTVAIFTHATPIRALYCFCNGLSVTNMKDIGWCTNASVSTVRFSDGCFKMEQYGFDEFLGEMGTKLPKNV